MSYKVLFHVGYHKTATSLLQAHLFSKKAYGFASEPKDRNTLIDAFVAPGPLNGPDSTAIEYLQGPRKLTNEEQVVVFSHERLSGYPAAGGIDQEIIARRIHNTFSDARILMIIREQKDMIKSMYLQYISDGGSLKLCDYLSGVDRKLFRKPQFSYEYYDYISALRMYRKYFGDRNVLCLPYEMMKSDPHEFFNKISKFCGLGSFSGIVVDDVVSKRVNKKRTYLELAIRRQINKLFRTQLSDFGFSILSNAHLNQGFKKVSRKIPEIQLFENYCEKKINDRILSSVVDYYREGNDALSMEAGMDLSRYGYETR